MDKRLYHYLQITDIKDMLNKTKELYGERPAYKIRIADSQYKIITHREVREMVDDLGTAICNLGLKGKRIAIIGENRYEWEIAYLSVVCGTGIVVPLDKSLPKNELEILIERSNIEAIFYSEKYSETIEQIKKNNNSRLKYLISMDLEKHSNEIYSQKELIATGKKLLDKGNNKFIKAQINPEEMNIMLFTSGTTSVSKVVALSHKNICSNLMDLASVLDVTSEDILLSNLPLHHVFECTVGFLFALYKGAQTVFSDGIRHIVENLKEYNATVMACVPGIYERMFKLIEKDYDVLGKNIKLFISGAASLDPKIEEKYRLLGINIVQGYGLTETSPVVAIGSNKYYKTGTIGKTLPSVEAKIVEVNKDGIGELIVKGPNVMLGYYENEKATNDAIKDGWFYTGDLAKIDQDGYIYICGRKKNVIVLKNGKNIFPEEMEHLVNKIDGVEESFIFGKQVSEDKENIKINVKIVFNREKVKEIYNAQTDEEIYESILNKIKEVNKMMPKYKSIRGMILTEKPLIKTTTNKIKRQANLDEIEKSKNAIFR